MNFPSDLNDDQIDRFEAIFASGDGEQLLRGWEVSYESAGDVERPVAGIQTLTKSIVEGKLDFATACLQVLPDRFFDLKTPLPCRDEEDLDEAIFAKLRAFGTHEPPMAARYHPLVELMVKRGWDVTYGTREETSWKIKPMLCRIADTTGCTSLLRRLLPHIGGAEVVRRYSDSYGNGLARADFNHTLLHRAVDTRDVEMVRFLVTEIGIDANTVDALGRTAFMTNLWILSQAAGFESTEKLEHGRAVVRELVQLGMDIEHCDNEGETALVYAVQDDNVEALRLLLELGADPAVRDGKGDTLLQLADQKGHEAVARILRSMEMEHLLGDAMSDDGEPAAPSRSSGGLAL